MDQKTCPHCEYQWTPRKAEPRKCPRCQNSLWQSPRPKRKRAVEAFTEIGLASAPEEGLNIVNLEAPTPIDIASARAKAEELFKKLA